MLNVLTVMLGGAVGAGARYALGSALAARLGAGFPWATLVVNLIGGLLMGMLAGLVVRGHVGEGVRLLVGVGVLGGFTTFSAFNLDLVRLVEGGAIGVGIGYLAASVVGSVALTFVGLALVRAA